MQIKSYGNGHSCNIPVQEIIDKYWKDETAPFSFEMSTAIGDETIAATAMLGEESPDTYPSIRLDSRNARKNSSATWFILETPNETNPYVTGYAYAGNDETESDSWITKMLQQIPAMQLITLFRFLFRLLVNTMIMAASKTPSSLKRTTN